MDTKDLKLPKLEQLVLNHIINTRSMGNGYKTFAQNSYTSKEFSGYSPDQVFRAIESLEAKEHISVIYKGTKRSAGCYLLIKVLPNGAMYAQKAVALQQEARTEEVKREKQWRHDWRLNFISGAYVIAAAALGFILGRLSK